MIVCISQAHNANTIVGHDALTDAQRFMDSIIGCCDALVFFDDASTDGTREVIGSFGDKIEIQILSSSERDRKTQWMGRARCLENARRLEADWIIALRTDEVLGSTAKDGGLSVAMESSEASSLAFPRRHLWRTDRYFRVDGPWGLDYPIRAFKLTPSLRYSTTKQYCTVPENIDDDDTGLCAINIVHYGYSTQAGIDRHTKTYKAVNSQHEHLMNENNIQFSIAASRIFERNWPHGPTLKSIYPPRT